MHTKAEILEELKKIFVELFDIEEAIITPEANLYEELDLDSIDAIDLIMKLQLMTGKKVKPEEFRNVKSVKDVVDIVYGLVKGSSQE